MTEKKPKVHEKELDKIQRQFDRFDEECKNLTQERMNEAPLLQDEPQTKISSRELEKSKQIWLKPERTIPTPKDQKFNEKFREKWAFAKEYVQFIAENKEIIGESIEIWTRPYGGVPAEFWRVPVNKAVWGPRYLAEQIKHCTYHRLSMQESIITGADSAGSYYGSLVVDNTVQRLDAQPVGSRKSIFMGAAA